ncbi:hypothetical protein [Desulfuribacillus alkaliarsenatis]|uniref:Uncharacterized protein n=1 Tax=Desulfuribacillus alkaliarsenatis TaxID=766136 RepID=A0A1E5FZU5_9FIRM|nr:hypothetical protein [Desulfuribacillus alkaliarsenatis]OEF95969.1 hypothetical protein BHF68_09460 [Desulfuribacillus alkaliarsenatis]
MKDETHKNLLKITCILLIISIGISITIIYMYHDTQEKLEQQKSVQINRFVTNLYNAAADSGRLANKGIEEWIEIIEKKENDIYNEATYLNRLSASLETVYSISNLQLIPQTQFQNYIFRYYLLEAIEINEEFAQLVHKNEGDMNRFVSRLESLKLDLNVLSEHLTEEVIKEIADREKTLHNIIEQEIIPNLSDQHRNIISDGLLMDSVR